MWHRAISLLMFRQTTFGLVVFNIFIWICLVVVNGFGIMPIKSFILPAATSIIIIAFLTRKTILLHTILANAVSVEAQVAWIGRPPGLVDPWRRWPVWIGYKYNYQGAEYDSQDQVNYEFAKIIGIGQNIRIFVRKSAPKQTIIDLRGE